MENVKNLKITAPDGYEVDTEKSTFENIVFKKKNGLPESWEDFCKEKNVPCYNNSFIAEGICSAGDYADAFGIGGCYVPDREFAEKMVAFMKLIQLRDRYRDGWEPEKFNGYVFSFPTRELCEKFHNNFEGLIEKTKDLLF